MNIVNKKFVKYYTLSHTIFEEHIYLIADLTKDWKYTSLRYAADLTPWRRIARDLSIYKVHSLHRKKED